MVGRLWGEIMGDRTYRIRCMRGLIAEIREDYAECRRIRERNGSGPGDPFEEERLGRAVSWLKQEMTALRELGRGEIEGITWGEVDRIEKEMRDIEINIKRKAISNDKVVN